MGAPGGPDATLFFYTDEGKEQAIVSEPYELENSTNPPVSAGEVVGKLERAVESREAIKTPAAVVGYEGQPGGEMSRIIPRRVRRQRRFEAWRAKRAEAR